MRGIEGEGVLVRIFFGEQDRYRGKPLYQALVERLRKEGVAGATVFRGIMGYGAHSVLHTLHVLRLSTDLPVVVEIVDTEEKIREILPILDEMIPEGLVTLEKVRVIHYRAGGTSSQNP